MAVGGILWLVFPKQINPLEWVSGTAISFLTAFIFHMCLLHSMMSDEEICSGQLEKATHYSAWLEYYEYAVYRRVYSGSGKHRHSHRVFDHWASSTRFHPESWSAFSNISTSYDIASDSYQNISNLFKDTQHATPGTRFTLNHASHMISGDPNDYYVVDVSQYIIPVTHVREWSNRVKAASSVFSFVKVPAGSPVFEYPLSDDPFHSARLLGLASQQMDLMAWDQMNAVVGVQKHCDVILVGFKDKDSSIAQMQQAKWIGGKENDVVICYGYRSANPDLKTHPDWVDVFSWTEKNEVKANIESYLLQRPISKEAIPFIMKEINSDFTIKDWHKFDYLSLEPPAWSYLLFLTIMAVVQAAFYVGCYYYMQSQNDSYGY